MFPELYNGFSKEEREKERKKILSFYLTILSPSIEEGQMRPRWRDEQVTWTKIL